MRVTKALVYRPAQFTPEGRKIASVFDDVYVPCFEGELEIDADELPPNLVVVSYDGAHQVHLEPAKRPEFGCVPWMDGGALVYARNDAFEALCGGPVRLFDRTESWEEAERLREAAADPIEPKKQLMEVM